MLKNPCWLIVLGLFCGCDLIGEKSSTPPDEREPTPLGIWVRDSTIFLSYDESKLFTKHFYDAKGRLSKDSLYSTISKTGYSKRYFYDAMDSLVKVQTIRKDGRRGVGYTFDATGKKLSEHALDSLDQETSLNYSYQYDAAGILIRSQNGWVEDDPFLDVYEEYFHTGTRLDSIITHEKTGKVINITDFFYEDGRLVKELSYGASRLYSPYQYLFEYTAWGALANRIERSTDGYKFRGIKYTYDESNRLIREEHDNYVQGPEEIGDFNYLLTYVWKKI